MDLISYCKLHLAFDNNRKITKNAKSKSEDVRQASEPDLDMAQTLGFKIIMIKVLMKRVDNMQEQAGNVSKEKH